VLAFLEDYEQIFVLRVGLLLRNVVIPVSRCTCRYPKEGGYFHLFSSLYVRESASHEISFNSPSEKENKGRNMELGNPTPSPGRACSVWEETEKKSSVSWTSAINIFGKTNFLEKPKNAVSEPCVSTCVKGCGHVSSCWNLFLESELFVSHGLKYVCHRTRKTWHLLSVNHCLVCAVMPRLTDNEIKVH